MHSRSPRRRAGLQALCMPDRPWKAEERHVAGMLGGRRHWANSGRRVDVESTGFVCQVKPAQSALCADTARFGVILNLQKRYENASPARLSGPFPSRLSVLGIGVD